MLYTQKDNDMALGLVTRTDSPRKGKEGVLDRWSWEFLREFRMD